MNKFNENDAPVGYVAVRETIEDADCTKCAFKYDHSSCMIANCLPCSRQDDAMVYFVKRDVT
jgi:hypothetical protein